MIGLKRRIGIVAVQRGADLVLQVDIGDVETAAAGDRERIGDIERVERIEPAILIGGAQRDRADRYRIAGLSEKYAAAADDKVRADGAEFGAGREVGDAGVEAGCRPRNWLSCPNSLSVLVACSDTPVVVEWVVVRSISPSTAPGSKGLAS